MEETQVARIREEIEEQCEAMRQGLSELIDDAVRRNFIKSQAELITVSMEHLAEYVGQPEAIRFVVEAYMRVVDVGMLA